MSSQQHHEENDHHHNDNICDHDEHLEQQQHHHPKKPSRYLSSREARELRRLLEKVSHVGVVKLPTTAEERRNIRRQQIRQNDQFDISNADGDEDEDEENEDPDHDEEDIELELPPQEEHAILDDTSISDQEKAERLEALRERIIATKRQQNAVNASAARCILKNLEQEGYLMEISSDDEEEDEVEDDEEGNLNQDDAHQHHEGDEQQRQQQQQQQQSLSTKSMNGRTGAASQQRKSVTMAPVPPSSPNHFNSSSLSRANSKSFGSAAASSIGSFSITSGRSKREELLQQKVVSTLKSVMDQRKKSTSSSVSSPLMKQEHSASLKRGASSVSFFSRKDGENNHNNNTSSDIDPQHLQLQKDRSTVKAMFGLTKRRSSLQQQQASSSQNPSSSSSMSNRKMTTKELLRSKNRSASNSSSMNNNTNNNNPSAMAARNAVDSVTTVLNAISGVFSCRFVALLVPDELKLRELRCVAYGGADANSRPMDSFSSYSSGSQHMLIPAASLALHHNTVINVRYPDSGDESDVEGSDLKELAAKRQQRLLLLQQQQQKHQDKSIVHSGPTQTPTTPKRRKNFHAGAVSTSLSVPIPGPSNYAVAVLHLMDRSFGVENFSREDESISWCYARIISRLIGAFESSRRVAPDRQVQRALATVLRSVDNATGAVDAAKIRKVLDGDLSDTNLGSKNGGKGAPSTTSAGMDGGWDDHAVTRAPPVFRTYSTRVEAMVNKLVANEVLFTTKTSEARGAIMDCEYHVNLNHFTKNINENKESDAKNADEDDKTCQGNINCLHPVVQVDDLLPLCVLTDHVHRVADAWYRTAALLAESRSEVGALQLDVKRLSQEVNSTRLKLDVQRTMLLNGGYHHNNNNSKNNTDGETSASISNNNNNNQVVIKRDRTTGAVIIERSGNNNSNTPFSLDDDNNTNNKNGNANSNNAFAAGLNSQSVPRVNSISNASSPISVPFSPKILRR